MIKKIKPKPVDPFNVSLEIANISNSLNNLFQLTAGYNLQQKRNLADIIARLAVIMKNQPDNAQARNEFNNAVENYEEKFGWTNE